MMMYLRSRGLWGQVEGSAPADPALMEKAHAAIVLGLTDSQVLHVIATTTAAEAWGVLQRLNESKDMASRMWLKEKFSTFRYTASSMEKHFEELEALVLQMGGAGCRPDEDDVCATLLRSLPASFEGLVQAFRMSVTKFAYGDVISRVLAEDIRQKEMGRIEEETAMLAGRGRQEGRKKVFNKKSVQCYQCGKLGHFKRECPNANEDAYESNVAFHVHDTDGGVCREWVVDSGASNHMCASKSEFVEYRVDNGGRTVSIAKTGVKLRVLGVGTVELKLIVGGRTVSARLENALHVENLSRNLFSIPAILSKAMKVEMDREGCEIKMKGVIVGSGTKRGNLIYLDVAEDAECHSAALSSDLWHRRLGHASLEKLSKLLTARGIDPGTTSAKICDVCALAKQVQKPFTLRDEDVTRRDDIVCSDVLGPITPNSRSGCAYAVSFIMMKTRFVKIYPIRKKSDVMAKFIEFCGYMKTQADVSIRVIRSDNGGEYTSNEMKTYCASKSIKQEFTIPHTPQQNGMAERANRTLVEMSRCMLKDSDLDKSFWAEALVTAAFVRNVISTTSRPHTTPYEETFKRKFEYKSMRVFGCECFAHVPKQKRLKLDDSGV
ncbi:reverse transcriptase, partial [Globisporangium polare]